MPRLTLKAAGLGSRSIELKHGSNSFGRSRTNDHRLEDDAVSECHCEVIVGEDSVRVRDLGSTNGIFVDGRPVSEAELQDGQTLRIGSLEFVLEGAPAHLSVPELAVPESPFGPVTRVKLPDGYPACLNHESRHAVWECTGCSRVFCDECIRKLRRVGGKYLRFCPACSSQCRLSAWSQMVKRRKRSIFSKLADKMRTSLIRTRKLWRPDKPAGAPADIQQPGKGELDADDD
jgi:hypothetical protein